MMKIISKTKWRVLSLLTALAMLLPQMPVLPAQVTALAEETAAEYGAFTVATEDGECSYSGAVLTISAGGEYTISQTAGVAKATSDTIKITAADDVIITLAGVNIESGNASPFLIGGRRHGKA